MKHWLTILGLLLLSAASANAQNWGGGVDDDDLHFGFTFQYLSSEYKIFKNQTWRDEFADPETEDFVAGKLQSIYAKSSPGFGIGFVSNYRLGENLDLRFTPTLVFNDRRINYKYAEPLRFGMKESLVEKKVQATMVDFPLGVKLKSDRLNNFRAYVIGGAKYSMNIVSAKKLNDESNPPLERFVKNKKNFLSYEAGFGLDLYFEYFKMSPEIKLSYSFNSVLEGARPNAYSAPLDRLMLRHVTFSLFFE